MCGFQGTRNRRWSARCAESLQDGSSGYEVTERKPRRRRTAQTLHSFPVTMAKGIHLFPYRTQKLSLSAPMVLGWRRPGRVGRCRIPWKKNLPLMGWVLFSFHLQRLSPKSSLTERSTYLVRISAPAPCGQNRGPISPGRVGQSQTDVRGFFLCAFVPSFPLSDRVQPSPNIKKQNTITVHLFTQSQKRFKRTVHALYKIYVFLRQKKQKEK